MSFMKIKTLIAALIIGLVSSAANAATVTLAWDPLPTSYNVTSYKVYQASDSTPFTQAALVGGTVSTVQISNLTNGVTYTFYVRAINSTGEGSPSNTVTNTPAVVPPAPTNLRVTTMSASRIDLQWQDASSNETGFVVQRALATGPYANIATVAANTTSFVNGGLLPRKNYCYRIFAFNDYGLSQGYAGPACERTFNH